MTDITRAIMVTFRLTMRDVFSTLFWINFRKFWSLILMFTICIVYIALNFKDEKNAPWALVWVSAMWILFTFVIPYLGARASAKSPNFQDVLQYTFSVGGVDFSGKYSSAHLAWQLVTSVKENKPYVMILLGRSLHLIPKASLSSEDLKSFKDLLRSSVSGKVRLKD